MQMNRRKIHSVLHFLTNFDFRGSVRQRGRAESDVAEKAEAAKLAREKRLIQREKLQKNKDEKENIPDSNKGS